MMENSSCPGYGEVGCPARFKCYPVMNQEADARFQEYQCLCDRTLMFGGDDCSQTHPLVYLTCCARVFFSILTLSRGCSILSHLLRRRYTRGTTPLVAIWTCVCQVLSNIEMAFFYSCDLMYSLPLEWSNLYIVWYHPMGRLYMQELWISLFVLSTLAISHSFVEKMKQLGLIRQQFLMGARVVFITFQLLVPSVSLWYRLVGIGHKANGSYYLSLLRVAVGSLCATFLMGSAAFIQRVINRARANNNDAGTPNSPGQPNFAVASLQNTQRLTSFTKQYFQVLFFVLLATASLHYVEQNRKRYPLSASHLLLIPQFFGLILLSNVFYSFLRPACNTIEGEEATSLRRPLPDIVLSVVGDWAQQQQQQLSSQLIQVKNSKRGRLVLPQQHKKTGWFCTRKKILAEGDANNNIPAGRSIKESGKELQTATSPTSPNALPFFHPPLHNAAPRAVGSLEEQKMHHKPWPPNPSFADTSMYTDCSSSKGQAEFK